MVICIGPGYLPATFFIQIVLFSCALHEILPFPYPTGISGAWQIDLNIRPQFTSFHRPSLPGFGK